MPIELEVSEPEEISFDESGQDRVPLESSEIEIIKAVSPTVELVEENNGVEIIVRDINGIHTAFVSGLPEDLVLDGGDSSDE